MEGNGAYYTRTPDPPTNLLEDISVRTKTQDGITWEDGPNTGGVPINDYRISLRESGGVYSVIAEGVTEKSYTITGLTLGVLYEVIIES